MYVRTTGLSATKTESDGALETADNETCTGLTRSAPLASVDLLWITLSKIRGGRARALHDPPFRILPRTALAQILDPSALSQEETAIRQLGGLDPYAELLKEFYLLRSFASTAPNAHAWTQQARAPICGASVRRNSCHLPATPTCAWTSRWTCAS